LVHSDSEVFSGAEKLLCEVVEGLAAGDAVDPFCLVAAENRRLLEGLSSVLDPEAIATVPAQPVSAAGLHLYDPRRLAALRRRLRDGEWDVALVNLGSAEYGATPLMLRNPPWRKAIGFVHVPGSLAGYGFRFGRVRDLLARRALASLDLALVCTPSARESFERSWGRPGLRVESVPVRRERLSPVPRDEARSRLGLPDAPLAGVAGRIDFKQKGQDVFVEAAGLLAAARPDVHFAIAGEGRDGEALRRLIAEAGLERRFHVLGHVEEIAVFLGALDVVAIPSRFEGLGLVALEAMQLGVPGVASDCDGLRDLWPQPWRVPAGDPARLAEAIGLVLDLDPAAREALVQEAERLLDGFVAEEMAPAFERHILRLAGEAAL
jgi:glycosyltransferase involved in cell wall biosynthesis